MKKIALLLISASLALCAILPVSAEDSETESPLPVINVVLPLSLDFTINPFELDGTAQVYSDIYSIQNLSDTEVLLTFSEVSVLFENDSDFEALTEPLDEEDETDKKAIYLTLNFERDNIEPFVLTDSDAALPTIKLGAAQDEKAVLRLQIGGNVNPYPAKKWRDGEVKIQLNYQIEAVESEEEESPEPEEAKISEKTATPGILTESEQGIYVDITIDNSESIEMEDS